MTEDILSRMLSARLPCDCVVKAAEHQLHEEGCLYRLVRDGLEEIERLRAENRRLRSTGLDKPAANADRHHWVRIMCFFGTNGMWNSDDETADVEALPFTVGLVGDIVAWRNTNPSSIAELETFSASAITLARRIKAEVPHWKVIYVDRTRAGGDIRSSDVFETEITV